MNHKKERLKAMILAAGRGVRMRPLTDNLPKPLLCAGNKTLIEYHIENLARAGFVDIVINHAYLGKMIETALGDGSRYGVNFRYSPETVALETAGGIVRALPLLESRNGNELGEQPFLIVNADIYCELNFSTLLPIFRQIRMGTDTAHLVMVSNQEHHPDGDFFLDSGRLVPTGKEKLTFSGISIYKPSFFYGIKPGIVSKLAPKISQAITEGKVSGEHYKGVWMDVGTPERLHRLDTQLRNK
jgi:MurNAc alpha-1-phosphate uridylyltransferase